MSMLSKLKPRKGSKKGRKRVGRGESSGWGKTAGRGHKGQLARSSADVPIGFEGGQMPLHRRSPKWGFTQNFRTRYHIVNLSKLSERFTTGEEVSPETLLSKGLIRNLESPVKILGTGELKTALKVRAHAISNGAKSKIEASKGSFEGLNWKAKASA